MKPKTKTKNFSIFLIFSFLLLMGGNFQAVSAQKNLDGISNFSVHVAITPDHVVDGSESHPIGYVYILNKNGVQISSATDVEVMLSSDNSSVASVPQKITFPANAPYANFDVTAGETGTTTITAQVLDKVDFTDITVGISESALPDELVLELNIPSNKMHVSSEMPFSVFLRTADQPGKDERGRDIVVPGKVVRAPFDIEVNLDYEASLATPNDDTLTIKEGEYYAWGWLTTGQTTGNAFIRAIQPDTQLDTAKSIEITSTLPAALRMYVYPYLVPAEIDRTLDVFVSLVDADGQPTVAHEDIPLTFFSNNQDYLGDELDDYMEELDMVIKKGEFGYHFRPQFDLIGFVTNDLFIGVSSPGYGVAIDRFQTVGESISVEDQRIGGAGTLITSDRVIKATDKKAVQLFGPLKIPSNATAVFAYQIAIEERDEGDNPDGDDDFIEIDLEDFLQNQLEEEEQRLEGVNPEDVGSGDIDDSSSSSDSDTSDDDEVVIYTIDNLEEGNLYPIQANEDYRATGSIKLLDVISGDASLANIKDAGGIKPGYSYGVAIVESTQNSGEVLLSANVKGVGSGSYMTEVVNSREQKGVRIFSPTGEDDILIKRDGSFDLFLVTLDGVERPKDLDWDRRYLVTPTNGIVDIERGDTFQKTTLQSESFTLTDGGTVNLEIDPIGQEADLTLESSAEFRTQLSSQVKIMVPNDNLDVEKEGHFGVVAITDLQGNPIVSHKDIRVKISSSDESIALTNQDAVIKRDSSYATFPIETTGSIGASVLSASARGLVGSDVNIKTSTSSSSLSVFTSGLIEPIPINEDLEVKLFVDDDTGDSIAGATVRISTGQNVTASTDLVRTGSDGSADFVIHATGGPEVTLDFEASAPGFQDGSDSRDIVVDMPENTGPIAAFDLPQELIYVIIGGIVVVGVIVGLFLKKSKEPLEEEEPWEEEDI